MTLDIQNPAMIGMLLLMLGLNIGLATKYLLERSFWVAAIWLVGNLFQFGRLVVLP